MVALAQTLITSVDPIWQIQDSREERNAEDLEVGARFLGYAARRRNGSWGGGNGEPGNLIGRGGRLGRDGARRWDPAEDDGMAEGTEGGSDLSDCVPGVAWVLRVGEGRSGGGLV